MHGLKLIDPAWYQIICFYTLLCFFYPRDLKLSFSNSQSKLIPTKFGFYTKGGILNSLMSTEGRAFSVSLNVVINIYKLIVLPLTLQKFVKKTLS